MITPLQGIQPLTAVTTVDAVKMNLSDDSRVASNELSPRASQDNSSNAQQGGLETKSDGKTSFASTPSQPDFSHIAMRLQEMMEDNTSVQFSIDEQTKKVILTIVDNETKEVVRQLPPEESLKIAQYITSKLEHGRVTDAKI